MLNLIIGFVLGFVVCQIWTVVKIVKSVKAGKVSINK